MITFQDFEERKNDRLEDFLLNAIATHQDSDLYKIATIADSYDHGVNVTINEFVPYFFTLDGKKANDFTASNNRIATNYFHRLNTQRNNFLLGNGVNFTKEDTKKALGKNFDITFKRCAYYALIHGFVYPFLNVDGLHCFKLTEFVALKDEETSAVRAGIRFWRIDETKPLNVVLYEEDGFTKYRTNKKTGKLEIVQPKRAYKLHYARTDFGGEELIGEANYSSLPIYELCGSYLQQSTIINLRAKIDSLDLIQSGYANDIQDVAHIYWLIENAMGMSESDIVQFYDRIKTLHVAVANTSDNTKVSTHTADVPHEARADYLERMRSELYEGFGALDVHTISAGATNDHIDAGYQPLEEEIDDYEFFCTECIKYFLNLLGIEDEPTYKRNRVSNQKETVDMIDTESKWLDERTVLELLPNITNDQVEEILKRKTEEDIDRFGSDTEEETKKEEDTEEEEKTDENS